jgi:hypothetical protein
LDEPVQSNQGNNNSTSLLGQDLSSLYNNPQPTQSNDMFSMNQQTVTSQPAFGLPKPPQRPPMKQGAGFEFPTPGQTVGIDVFANLAAPNQVNNYQPSGANQQQQPSSTNNLESVFNQMTLQQTQYQPQATENYGAGQNSYGSSGQFQGTGQFGQNAGQFGQSTGQFGQSTNQFGSSTGQFGQSTSGFGTGTAQFGPSSLSPPSSDVFGNNGPNSNITTHGSMSSQSSNASTKINTDEFGAFQSSEKDAWSMGKGLGKIHVIEYYS